MTVIITFLIVCIPNLSRTVPINYFLLLGFTVCESYLVAFLCVYSLPKTVFMAASMTLVMVLALTVYAITTKNDLTMMGGVLFIGLAALILLGVFGLFFDSPFLHIVICLGGTFLFSFYLIYDTQLIIGNKKEMVDMDDYILGSFNLYLDIINLFVHILSLLSKVKGEK